MRCSWAKNSVRLSEHPVRLVFKNKIVQLASRHYPHVTYPCNGGNFELDSNSPEALKYQICRLSDIHACPKQNTRFYYLCILLNHFNWLCVVNYKVHFPLTVYWSFVKYYRSIIVDIGACSLRLLDVYCRLREVPQTCSKRHTGLLK